MRCPKSSDLFTALTSCVLNVALAGIIVPCETGHLRMQTTAATMRSEVVKETRQFTKTNFFLLK